MELEENAHSDLLKKGFENRLHYINTPKQLILDFYDCKNDNFHVKIVIFLLLLLCFFWLKNVLWVHPQSILSKNVKKNVFPCLNPSLSI